MQWLIFILFGVSFSNSVTKLYAEQRRIYDYRKILEVAFSDQT